MTKAKIILELIGEFTQKDMTAFLKTPPARALDAGTQVPDQKLPRTSIWEFETRLVQGDVIFLGDEIDKYITTLAPFHERLAAAQGKWKMTTQLHVGLVLDTREERPSVAAGLSQDAIHFLGKVGALLDMEIYYDEFL